MKSAFSLLVLIATIGLAHAGGFGGPPPFKGSSPLQSGTDGVYQAVASATNVTGLFAFSIVGGIQTSAGNENKWVFFIDGVIISGSVSANISNDKVAGVLDSGLSGGVATDDEGDLDLPAVILVPGNTASGFFTGAIDLNSPIAAFEGEGALQGTPERVDKIIIIDTDLPNGFVEIRVSIDSSDFDKTEFKFRGTRLTTTGR